MVRAEYFDDVTLIAYFVQFETARGGINYKEPYLGFKVVNKHFDKIRIGSGYWTEKFGADSVEEAIKRFKEQSWEPC